MLSNPLKNLFELDSFKFSIIMAVYNSEEYLNESIDSVINQSIGFKNIELILVDDGSNDDSKNICLKYKNKFPKNITYIYQENQGQAVARNNGMKIATGKYINFLDSDDKLDFNALRLVYDFFEKNYENVDVVSIPLRFFDRQQGDHILNYKYEKTRLIDLKLEPSYIQLSASSTFIKKEAIRNHEFNSELIVSEDALFINKLLLEKCKHGVISNTYYYYRKRENKTSTIDSSINNKKYYLERSNIFFKGLFDYSIEKYGEILEFIKYTVMYDIQWMFFVKNIENILTNEELNQLYSILHELLSKIDDKIIIDQKHPDKTLINSILLFKHGQINTIKENNNIIKKVGDYIIDKLNYHPIYIDGVEISNDTLNIIGYFKSFFDSTEIKIHALKYDKNRFLNYWIKYFNKNIIAFIKKKYLKSEGVNLQYYLINSNNRYDNLDITNYLKSDFNYQLKDNYTLNEIENLIEKGLIDKHNYYEKLEKQKCLFIENLGEIYPAKQVEYPFRDEKYLNLNYNHSFNFEFEIPLKILEKTNIQIKIMYGDLELYPTLFTNYYSKLTTESYYSKKENYLISIENNQFYIQPYALDEILELDSKNLEYLISKNDSTLNETIKFRKLYHNYIAEYMHKRIWLFYDRIDAAGDNAEQLFKYSLKQNDGIEKYFVISKESKDYKRLKKFNNIIEFKSEEHKLLACFAEKIITSHPNDEIINPFFDLGEKYYNGLFSAKVCFIQHGIILHDISSWLHKYDKYLHLFVTSVKKEYESILKNPYNYSEDTIQILGLPRYDNLESGNEKNQIIIMPTWRNFLEDLSEAQIKDSEYFKIWNKLLNNKELLTFAEKNNYKIIFKPHINSHEYINLFDLENVILGEDISYTQAFNESKLLITDYSSVAFDFAYLKKPVLYYQKENDGFHFDLSKSYFDYDTMGFGEISRDENELINLIKEYLSNNCKMKNKYKKRIDDFYKFNDKNNSKRVYEFLLNMKR